MRWKQFPFLGLDANELSILNTISVEYSVSELSEKVPIPRTTIAYTLTKLVRRGLVRVHHTGKRKKYIAISPSEILETVGSFVDIVVADNTNKKSFTRKRNYLVHVGVKNMTVAYENAINTSPKGRLRGIQPNKSWMTLHTKNLRNVERLNNLIKKRSMIVEGLVQESAYAEYRRFFGSDKTLLKKMADNFYGRMADYASINDSYFDRDSELVIFPDRLLINNWKDEVSVEISNADIVGFATDMFDVIKSRGKKIDHNRLMREMRG